MTVEERYRERYKSGDTPWDVGQPDFNLIELVLFLTEAVFTHSILNTIDECLPRMSPLIWQRLACGLQSLATLMSIAKDPAHLNEVQEI